MKRYILDSSAIMAVINQEPGREKVEPLLTMSLMSSVNMSEIIGRMVLRGASAADAHENIFHLVPYIIPFDEELAVMAGGLIIQTKSFGLSLGDRACLATAQKLGVEVVTADKQWAKLDLLVKIRFIR
jgi:PIN domain nuclease of toxin-antitoxin system